MEHVAAILLLVACGEGNSACRELPAPLEAYETTADCQADLPAASRNAARHAPHIYGACVSIDPAMIYDNLEIVWDVTPEGKFDVSVNIDAPAIIAHADHASAPSATAQR